jgi:hypothetical protein
MHRSKFRLGRAAVGALIVMGAMSTVLFGFLLTGAASASPPSGFTPSTVVGDNNSAADGCDDVAAVTTPDQFTALYWVTSTGAVWEAYEYNNNHIYEYQEVAANRPTFSGSARADRSNMPP